MMIQGKKIDYFKELLDSTKNALSETRSNMEKNLAQYNGDAEVDGSAQSASHTWNITRELIEAKVNTTIPSPRVRPRRLTVKTDRNARSVEMLCNALLDLLPVEEMNDLDERYTYIYGGSAWLVEWNESERTHDTVGDISVTLLNPQYVYPQPNCYRVEDMQYIFIRFDTVREELVRRYGVSYKDAVTSAGAETDIEHPDGEDSVTVYVCYYKDEEDTVCMFAWSDDLVLADYTDYYARKRRFCKTCGKREELCTCEHPEYELASDEYEELKENIQLQHSMKIQQPDPVTGQMVVKEIFETIPAKTPVLNADGTRRQKKVTVDEPVLDEQKQLILGDDGLPLVTKEEQMQDVMEPTRLPYYKPKSFPVIIRKNISRDRCLLGASDCAAIREQQQTVNKLKSRILEKLMRSSVTPVMPEDAAIAINNQIFGNVIRLSPGENKGMYGVIDTSVDVSIEQMQLNVEYDNAKRILGISDSYQGQDSTASKSGYAKQIEVAQSAGRLESTRVMKNAAWAKIFRSIFELCLAYADEPRPIAYKDEYGKLQNLQFNRYDFLEMDEETLEWYYDDAYLFSVDLSRADQQDKVTQWAQQMTDYGNGLYGQPGTTDALLQLWVMREQAHYPHARDMVEKLRRQKEAEIQMQQQQMGGGVNGAV